MSMVPIVLAGIAYFMLGGLWFTPLFGKQWDKAVGFERPARWRPSIEYYIGPLFGCIVSSLAVGMLFSYIHPQSLMDAMKIGIIIGAGFGASVTAVNAISPNMPRPYLYGAVTGSYHCAGLILCSLIHFGMQ